MTLKLGRTRYTRGWRCEVSKAAERDYQRNRYRRRHRLTTNDAAEPPAPALRVVAGSGADSPRDGPVVAAVRAELDGAPAAAERPGLAAVALAIDQTHSSRTAVPLECVAFQNIVANW